MLVAACGRHLEDNVLERGRLASGPVNTGDQNRGADSGKINDKVTDLTPEDVRGSPTELAIGLILITIEEETRVEACASLENRHATRIANQHGVVIVDDWLRHDVCARRKVDQGGCRSG